MNRRGFMIIAGEMGAYLALGNGNNAEELPDGVSNTIAKIGEMAGYTAAAVALADIVIDYTGGNDDDQNGDGKKKPPTHKTEDDDWTSGPPSPGFM